MNAPAAVGAARTSWTTNLTRGQVVAGAAGAFVVGGLLGTMGRTDGSQHVSRRRMRDYVLQPTSKEGARHSLGFQRFTAGGAAILGVALGAYGILRHGPKHPGLVPAIFGAGMVGYGITRLADLHGAERNIDPSLPEQTPLGSGDMVREHGAGTYRNVYGWPTHQVQVRTGPIVFPQVPASTWLQPVVPDRPLVDVWSPQAIVDQHA